MNTDDPGLQTELVKVRPSFRVALAATLNDGRRKDLGPHPRPLVQRSGCFIETTAAYPPLVAFAHREPAFALKVLMAPEGHVAEKLRSITKRILHRSFPGQEDRITDDMVEIFVQVATALEWVPIIIGNEPEPDRALGLCRTLVSVAVGLDLGLAELGLTRPQAHRGVDGLTPLPRHGGP